MERRNLTILDQRHSHEKLINSNVIFTFSIGNVTKGGSTTDTALPYANFDLSVNYPIVANKTRYFPLMRAANDSQYTLGRAFLQEASVFLSRTDDV